MQGTEEGPHPPRAGPGQVEEGPEQGRESGSFLVIARNMAECDPERGPAVVLSQ